MPHEPQPNDETGSSAHSGDTNIVEFSSGGRSGGGSTAKKSAAHDAKKGAARAKKRPSATKKRATSKSGSAAANKPSAKSGSPAAQTPGPPPPLPPEFVGPRPTSGEDLVIPPRPDLPQTPVDEIPPKPALPSSDVEGSDAEASASVPEGSQIEDATVAEVQVEAAQVDEAPVDEPPVDEVSVDDATAEEPQVEEVPAVEAPVDEAHADEATVDEATIEDAVVDSQTDPAGADEIDADADAMALASVLGDDTDETENADGAMLTLRGVSKRFGETRAVEGIDLTIPAGTFYGLVGPNGAGKTTTLSMIAGLLSPDKGEIRVGADDLPSGSRAAKRLMGVLPDRLRTFDRLTGRQLLYYYGVLRGLKPAVVESRTVDLARVFDLTDALGRVVADYSAGMLKKIMLAGAMIHSPRVLVLDEPFEAVDPVSSSVILDILTAYVDHGGTVILSSHGMDLVERVCTRLAVIVAGQVLAEGTIDEVRGELTLEQRFMELAGGIGDVEGLEWLHTFSD